MRARWIIEVAFIVALVAAFIPGPGARAWAQEDDETRAVVGVTYSIDGYQVRRARLSEGDAQLEVAPSGTHAWASAARDVVAQTLSLLEYLTGWLNSGRMPPEVVAEATAQRFVLFENLVWLQVDLGECSGAGGALATLEVLAPERPAGVDASALIASAREAVAACVDRPLTDAPDGRARVERAVVRRRLAISSGVVAAVGIATWVATEPSRRAYRDGVAAQELEWTVARDASLTRDHDRLERAGAAGIVLGSIGAAGLLASPWIGMRGRDADVALLPTGSGAAVRVGW